MTFSIVGHCVTTGQFGMAVASSSPAVAARCAYAQAGIGAVASQNVTDPRLGTKALEQLSKGLSADEALRQVIGNARHTDYRQLMIVDRHGGTAIHSGPKSLGIHAEQAAKHVAAAGNLLANDKIPGVMVETFQASEGHLGDCLIAAMNAALDAGGEAGPVHSAGLLLVDTHEWPLAELRCDWTEVCPIESISKAWDVYRPQMDDYVTRALNPTAAPSYAVPGDE